MTESWGIRFRRLFADAGGVATSLLEPTATIAVGATLAAGAVAVISDKIHDGKIASAHVDVEGIGDAINKFYADNTFFPIFFSPDTHRDGLTIEVLKSKNGDEAGVPSPKLKDENLWTKSNSDTIENQLVDNSPGGAGGFFGFGGGSYPLKGEIDFDATRGWDGPYLSNPPPADPWGNKYYVNVKFFHPDELLNRRVVFVISPGPNELLQTPFTMSAGDAADKLQPLGDDIAERLR